MVSFPSAEASSAVGFTARLPDYLQRDGSSGTVQEEVRECVIDESFMPTF